MAATNSYNTKEKLKSRKLLEQLFTKGRSFSVFPLKVFYMPLPGTVDHAVKAGVGVSAKHFRKAVDRNRIKRLLRECYRLNKQSLYATKAGGRIFFVHRQRDSRIFIPERKDAGCITKT
jgi:ribonuclease P protein component